VSDPSSQLKATIRRLRPASPGPVELRPTNPFEVQVAEHLKAIDAELDQLRSRLNWLLTIIVGAAITNIVIALLK
jgi:hypothetical protein